MKNKVKVNDNQQRDNTAEHQANTESTNEKEEADFGNHIPNRVTRKTLENSRKGKGVKSFKNIEDLFKDLGI